MKDFSCPQNKHTGAFKTLILIQRNHSVLCSLFPEVFRINFFKEFPDLHYHCLFCRVKLMDPVLNPVITVVLGKIFDVKFEEMLSIVFGDFVIY